MKGEEEKKRDEMVKRIIAQKSPEEISQLRLKLARRFLTIIASVSIFNLVVFFPYDIFLGEAGAYVDMQTYFRASLLIVSLLGVASFIGKQIREIIRESQA